jgi:putative glycosyl hydrolase-like family 15 (GHL15) protein
VQHYWAGIFAGDAFDYSTSARYDDFIAHTPDSWATQGAKFKAAQPNSRAFVYQDFGVAGDGVSTVVSRTAAQSSGRLATHNGATIANPWGGTNLVVDLGKPGVQAAYISALQSKLAAHPWDGVFADDVNDWQNLWANGQGIDGYTSSADYLKRALLPLLQAAKAQISKPIVPNIGGWANQPALDGAADALDGGNQEFFLMWGNGQSLAPPAIENERPSMRHELAAGKPYYGIVHRTDVQGLRYAFCGAAIMGGDHPNLTRIANEIDYGSAAPTWDASLETQLGGATTAVQHVTGSTTLSRSFASGKTLTIDTAAQTCSGLAAG